MKPDTATKKGLLTGIVMVLISICIYLLKGNFQNSLQYITYTVYIAGIIWTLLTYSKQPGIEHKFGQYFSQGFKCFIVVTLLMVVFTAIFLISQPQLKDEMATIYRAELIKAGNYTTAEIEDKIGMAKKSFLPSLIMATVFGYLVIGAMVTVIAAGFISSKNKNKLNEK